MVKSVPPIVATSNSPKGFNSYFTGKKKRAYIIESLPPELTTDKPKKKTWTELLSPWLISVGFIIFVAVLNGLIGG